MSFDPTLVSPETWAIVGAFYSLASGAAIEVIKGLKERSDDRKRAIADMQAKRDEDAKTVRDLIGEEVSRAIAASGTDAKARELFTSLLSDEVFLREFGTWAVKFACDPAGADEYKAYVLDVARAHAIKFGMDWEAIRPDLEEAFRKVMLFTRKRIGGYLSAFEHKAIMVSLDELRTDAQRLLALLPPCGKCFFTVTDWAAHRQRNDLLTTPADLEARFWPRMLRPLSGGAASTHDATLAKFLSSTDKALLVLGSPGIGKTQLLSNWCHTVAKEPGWSAYFLDVDALPLLRPPLPATGNILIAIDEAGQTGSANVRQAIGYLASLLAAQEPGRVIRFVLADWTRHHQDIENKCKDFLGEPLELVPLAWTADDDSDYRKFLKARFGATDEKHLAVISRVSEGNPQIALKAVQLLDAGKQVTEMTRGAFMKRVLRDWRNMATAGCGKSAAELADIVAFVGRFSVAELAAPAAEFLSLSPFEVAKTLSDLYVQVAGDFLVREDGDTAVYSIRPDIWRIYWFESRFLAGDPDALVLCTGHFIRYAPADIIFGFTGAAQVAADRERAVKAVREIAAPTLFGKANGVALLTCFSTLYKSFSVDELPNATWNLEILRAARERAVKEDKVTDVLWAATVLATRGEYHEAIDWFEACQGHVPESIAGALANNWGNALNERARLFGQLEGREQDSEKAFKESFEKYALALKIEPDDHEAANNWGSALSEEAQLLGRLEGREADAEKVFEESFKKYALALGLKPDYHAAAYNWGIALGDEARLLARLEGRERDSEKASEESFKKYALALDLKPSVHEAAINWGSALIEEAQLLARVEGRESDAENAFEKSFKKYALALRIKPDVQEAAYNWGSALSEEAQLLGRLEGREADAERAFEESFKKYALALDLKPDYHSAAWNWGASLLSRSDLHPQAREKDLTEACHCFSAAIAIATCTGNSQAVRRYDGILDTIRKRALTDGRFPSVGESMLQAVALLLFLCAPADEKVTKECRASLAALPERDEVADFALKVYDTRQLPDLDVNKTLLHKWIYTLATLALDRIHQNPAP